MELEEVTAYAHERLGLEIQAVSRLRSSRMGRRQPVVWSLLTAHGRFWLVAEAGQVELFRAPSAVVAVRQFLELHPEGPDAPPTRRVTRAVTPPTPPPSAYDCRTCGTRVTPHRRSVMQERQLCPRCRHLEHGRERYRGDPAYRARLRASRRARYREARGRAAS